MNYSEVLETYLFRLARGELIDTSSVAPLIPKSVLYLPVKMEKSDGFKSVLTVSTIFKKDTAYLPIFLKRNHVVTAFEKDSVSVQEVRGESLLKMLPPSVGLVFEPNTSLEVFFDPKDFGEDFNKSYLKPPAQILEKNNDFPPELETLFDKEKVDIGKLEADLIKIFMADQIVNEAFIIEHRSLDSDLILGLVTNSFTEDERYRLSEEIARISIRYYNYAGAIKVFDDLSNPESVGWLKFKTEAPFFSRDNITRNLEISKTIDKGDGNVINPSKISALGKPKWRLLNYTKQ